MVEKSLDYDDTQMDGHHRYSSLIPLLYKLLKTDPTEIGSGIF